AGGACPRPELPAAELRAGAVAPGPGPARARAAAARGAGPQHSARSAALFSEGAIPRGAGAAVAAAPGAGRGVLPGRHARGRDRAAPARAKERRRGLLPALERGRSAEGAAQAAGGRSEKAVALRFRRLDVGLVEQVEGLLAFPEELVLVAAAPARALEQRLHARGFGDRYPARVEIVDQDTDLGERRVALQPEAGEQLLERHLVPAVAERGALVREAHGVGRSLLVLVEPHDLGFRVDEAPDEPGGAEPVGPQGTPRGPGALEVAGRGIGGAPAARSVGKHQLAHLGFGLDQRARGALARVGREEVERADGVEFA